MLNLPPTQNKTPIGAIEIGGYQLRPVRVLGLTYYEVWLGGVRLLDWHTLAKCKAFVRRHKKAGGD